MQLKILSWNIWVFGNFSQITNFLKESDPDIIALQEVQADDPGREIIKHLQAEGYQHVFAPVAKEWGGKVWNDGPAIFSRYPVVKTETYILSGENSRAAIRADIQVEDKILHAFSTHLVHTHQQQSATQEEQAENFIKVLPGDRTLVMGDFNAVPDSRAIQRMQETLINADPSSTPTWSVYLAECCNIQDVSICLDYIFTSKDIKIKSFKVEQSKASDHLPISALIEI